jgi:HNH endonuclease
VGNAYISAELRRLVAARAERLCEYCLIHEESTFLGCQVDHIISEKHGGPTEPDNLAFACSFCNQYKGSDVGSYVPESGRFVRFFNPRTDRWADHFALGVDGVSILPWTEIGAVTARILQFNSAGRIEERRLEFSVGSYPHPAALRRMRGES